MNKVIIKNVDYSALRPGNTRSCASMTCTNRTNALVTLVVNEYMDEFVMPLCTKCIERYTK